MCSKFKLKLQGVWTSCIQDSKAQLGTYINIKMIFEKDIQMKNPSERMIAARDDLASSLSQKL